MQRRKLICALVGGVLGSYGLRRQEAGAEEWIVSTIFDAAGRHGVSGQWLLNTAVCESKLDPWAYNEMTGDICLFQFKPETYAEWGGSPDALWDVWSQADMLSRWVCIRTGAARGHGRAVCACSENRLR